MKKLLSLTAVCMAALLAAGCTMLQAEDGTPEKVTTAAITRGDLTVGLAADGRVALPVSNLNFAVAGTLSAVYVEVGDTVQAGDLLAELDDSSYQFSITSAENAVTKAQTAYDNAVAQAEYDALADETDLAKLQAELDAGFDAYTYQTAVTDAEVSLTRKREALAEAEANMAAPFDPYTYDTQIAEAETQLAEREEALAEAKAELEAAFDDYSYQNAITEAQTNLDRKQAALAEATAEMDIAAFDSYQYDAAIATAQSSALRKQAEYVEAQRAYEEAVSAGVSSEIVYTLNDAYTRLAGAEGDDEYEAAKQETISAQTEYEKAVSANETAVDSAKTKVTTAKNAYDDASKSLTNAKDDLERAKETFLADAPAKVTAAQEAADDAQRQLDKATADLERALAANAQTQSEAVEAAQEACDDALVNLEKLLTDRERAEAQAAEDAAQQLDSAREALTDAETALAKAKTSLSRAQADHAEQQAETADTLTLRQMSADMNANANATIADSEFNLEEAKLNLEEARENLDQVKLYAPIDGQILSVSKGAGETVTAETGLPGAMMFGTGDSGNNLMTLCDVTEIYLTASITEGDIVGVTQDQTIRVAIDAIGEETFEGVVTNVDSIPTTDSNGITTYTVTCKLNDTSSVIKDGMNAYITFIKREQKDVLLVPNKAVFMVDELQYVNVVRADGTYEQRKVVCGLSNGVQTEVTDGLAEGETVLTTKLS